MTKARQLAEFANDHAIFRNKIINGNFDFWQRGTNQTSSGYGSVDRWSCGHGTSSKTASQQSFTNGQTDVPGNPKFYIRHVVTSSSGGYVVLSQLIEGVETLAGKTATLSFYAKADSNKNIASGFIRYYGTGGSPSAFETGIGVTTHNLTTSWQKFTVTTTIPSISGKTIGTDDRDYLGLEFWFDAGSSINARSNSLGNQSGTFDIAQVQLEEGTLATPFEHRPIGMELSLCERYYQVKNLFGTNTIHYAHGYYGGSANYNYYTLNTTMRSAPSVTISQPTQVQIYHNNGSWTNVTITVQKTYTDLIGLYFGNNGNNYNGLIRLTGDAADTKPTALCSSEFT